VSGIYYYQLEQVDLDGTKHYSHRIGVDILATGLASITPDGVGPGVRVLENPGTRVRIGRIGAGNVKVDINLMDSRGTVVACWHQASLPGTWGIEQNLANGVYYIHIVIPHKKPELVPILIIR
jgi:hypothetical protein